MTKNQRYALCTRKGVPSETNVWTVYFCATCAFLDNGKSSISQHAYCYAGGRTCFAEHVFLSTRRQLECGLIGLPKGNVESLNVYRGGRYVSMKDIKSMASIKALPSENKLVTFQRKRSRPRGRPKRGSTPTKATGQRETDSPGTPCLRRSPRLTKHRKKIDNREAKRIGKRSGQRNINDKIKELQRLKRSKHKFGSSSSSGCESDSDISNEPMPSSEIQPCKIQRSLLKTKKRSSESNCSRRASRE